MFNRVWVLVVISGCLPAYSQVAIGIQAGVPLTNFLADRSSGGRFGSSSVTSGTRRYTLGPSLDLGIRGPFGLEVGALYKRFGFASSAGSGGYGGPSETIISSTHGNSLEFPVLGKLHLRLFRGLNGFVSAGPSIRHLSGISESGVRTVRTFFPPPGETTTTTYETDSPQGLNRRTSFGATLGGGLEFRLGRIMLSPGVRLTRWDTERTSDQPAGSRLNRTQVDALLGISYVAVDREQERAGIHGRFGFGVLAGVPLLSTSEAPSRSVQAGTARRRRRGGLRLVPTSVAVPPGPRPGSQLPDPPLRAFPAYTQPGYWYGDSLKGSIWEVPLLVKWRPVRLGQASLFIGGGPALRRASHIDWVNVSATTLPFGLMDRFSPGPMPALPSREALKAVPRRSPARRGALPALRPAPVRLRLRAHPPGLAVLPHRHWRPAALTYDTWAYVPDRPIVRRSAAGMDPRRMAASHGRQRTRGFRSRQHRQGGERLP